MLTQDENEIIHWINYQLNSLGFPLIQKKENLKIVYNLLLVVDKESNYSQKLVKDVKLLELELKNLTQENQLLAKKNEQFQEKLSNLELNCKDKTEKLQNEKAEILKLKDEVVYLKKSLASLKALHNHETRGKSIQIDLLKDLINQKLNSLPKYSKKSVKVKTTEKFSGNEEMDFLFSNYQQREKELLDEISKLKDYIWEITQVFKQEFDIEGINISKNISEMPLGMIQDNLNLKLKSLVSLIKQKIMQEPKEQENAQELEEKIKESESLRKQLQESNELLELMIKQEKSSKSAREHDFTMEEIELQKKELENARMLLDQERKQFTEAAVRMGIERAALQKEKEVLQETKRQAETEDLLKQMPSTPFWLKKTKQFDVSGSGPLTKSTPLQNSTQDLIDTLSKLEAPEFVMESDTIQFDTPCQNKAGRGILKSTGKKSPLSETKFVRIKDDIQS